MTLNFKSTDVIVVCPAPAKGNFKTETNCLMEVVIGSSNPSFLFIYLFKTLETKGLRT